MLQMLNIFEWAEKENLQYIFLLFIQVHQVFYTSSTNASPKLKSWEPCFTLNWYSQVSCNPSIHIYMIFTVKRNSSIFLRVIIRPGWILPNSTANNNKTLSHLFLLMLYWVIGQKTAGDYCDHLGLQREEFSNSTF